MDVLQDKSVLVVDDEPMLREILRDVLEFEGARVCEAAHAKDALARLSQEPVDAVISDIRMPGGDGFELLAGIRDRDTGMPVVLMITGFSDISAELAYAMGADAIHAKPFEVPDLLASLRRLLTGMEERFSPGSGTVNSNGREKGNEGIRIDLSRDKGVRIGRGGVFIPVETAVSAGGFVGFRIPFGGAGQVFTGTGFVRWVRSSVSSGLPSGAGVEFLALEPDSLAFLKLYLEQNPVRAYIPDGS